MYSLLLDSATKKLYIAIVKDNEILYEKYTEGRNDHAKYIVSNIDEALKKLNISIDDIDEIICGEGPGSYTGVRMAVTVAKMISSFKNKPLYKISTLKLMASGTKGIVFAYIDARRGNVFGTIIDTINNKIIVDEAHISFEEIKANKFDIEINEDNYKVDPLYCISNKELVEFPDLFTPNYLRDTEAERNLNDKKI